MGKDIAGVIVMMDGGWERRYRMTEAGMGREWRLGYVMCVYMYIYINVCMIYSL